MATLTTADVAAGVQTRTPHSGVAAVSATFTLTAALAGADVIQMVKIPKNAQILDVILTVTDLDTGTPAIVLDVGDGDDVDRFIDGATTGQAGGTVRMGSGITTATNVHTYTADDTIDVTVATAPGTGATTGTVTLAVLYMMES